MVRGSETFAAIDLAEQQKWLAGLVILGWCLPYFISTANFYVKFMRYMQPLVPFLMLFAAWGLWSIPQRRLRQLALTAVLLPTVAFAMAFVNIYRAPHPWIATSQWIFDEVPAGSTVAVELWDEALPSSLVVNGERLNRRDYAIGRDELAFWLQSFGSHR